jgi:hypothetical protein
LYKKNGIFHPAHRLENSNSDDKVFRFVNLTGINCFKLSEDLNGTEKGFELIGLHVILERFRIGPSFHPKISLGGVNALKNAAVDAPSRAFMHGLFFVRQYFKRLYKFMPVLGRDGHKNLKDDHPLPASWYLMF